MCHHAQLIFVFFSRDRVSLCYPEEDYPGWHTIDITAVNRPHLLADIAETFFAHNISLRYAKITTLDQRIEDSFITYSPSLQDPQTQNTLKQALIEVLTP